MAKQKETTDYLQIPIEGKDIPGEAGKLRKHLMLLQRLAMNNLFEGDDLTKAEMEAFRSVTDLMIQLQEIEDETNKQPETPP